LKLSIITINRNNADGLRKTTESVLSQTSNVFEYIIIDGSSDDDSLEVIKNFERNIGSIDHLSLKNTLNSVNIPLSQRFVWISEPDTGIYNAMNKGIKLAKGEYLQFLNSGDVLTNQDVTKRMLDDISDCDILYGNMLKQLPGRIIRDCGFAGRNPTMLDFYFGTLNHSPAYIRRCLFEKYGLYDETLKIVADYKWYLQVIILNGVVPVYKDIDVTLFDMNGISNLNSNLDKTERSKVLKNLLPPSILIDYDQYSFYINQVKRINRFWITRKGFYLVERFLFKYEKWFNINVKIL